jgi:putative oxidoreductase
MFETDVVETPPTRFAALRAALPSLPRAGLALLFVGIGYTKFNSDPQSEWVTIFARIGFGQWFRYLAGMMQVAGGALFLFHRTITPGAALLASTMLGAVIVDFVMMPPFMFIPLMLLFATVTIWILER